MNCIYLIIAIFCVVELTAASYYRIPKRYFKGHRQEIKQAKNAPMKTIQTRNIPVLLPVPEKSAQIIAEIPVTVNFGEEDENKNDEVILNEEQILPLESIQPVSTNDIPKMQTLPVLTILPIVASLPVVDVRAKVAEKLPDVEAMELTDCSSDTEDEWTEDVSEQIEGSTVSMSIIQEIKYEIVEGKSKKSPILHKLHRIEEFKRNIFLDRREEPKK